LAFGFRLGETTTNFQHQFTNQLITDTLTIHYKKMKKLLTYLYLSFLSLPLLTAQQGSLTGLILDAETGEALIAATVRSGGNGTITDIEGRYELQLPEGEQSVEISYIGFETQRLLIKLLQSPAASLKNHLEKLPCRLRF